MTFCMREKLFEEFSYGKAALEKFGIVDDNFRIYCCGYIGEPKNRTVMKVTGAIFREVKSGKNKGNLSIKVKGTDRTVYVTDDEIAKFKDGK